MWARWGIVQEREKMKRKEKYKKTIQKRPTLVDIRIVFYTQPKASQKVRKMTK